MKKVIIIYILFLPFLTYCQLFTSEIGIINDTDGYTLIREGTTTSFPIKDTIFEKEFFQFIPNDTIDGIMSGNGNTNILTQIQLIGLNFTKKSKFLDLYIKAEL